MEKKPLNLLILEDNPDDAELMVSELESGGFTVEWGRVNTEEAFRESLAKNPDLLLVDYKLSLFDGISALKMRQRLAPEIPLIIVSGTIGEKVAVECMKAGATDYVLKDNLSRLGPVVKRALDEAEEQRGRKEAEELYQTFTEKSFAGVYMVQDGVFQFLNPNAASYAGYTPEELAGKASISIIHPEDKKMAQENAVKMLSGEYTSPHKFRIVTKDGSIRWIMEMVTSIHYKGKPAILGNSMDITEKVMAEEALQQSEGKYRTLIESTLDLVFKIDRKGLFTYINPRFEAVLGYTASDLAGRPFTYIIAPEHVEATIGRFKRGIRGEAVPSYEADLVHKDGKRVPIEFLVTTLYDLDGKTTGRFGIGRDITERKRAEAALRKAEQEKAIILDNMSELVFYIDSDMRVLSANKAVYKAFNLSTGQLEGKICYEVFHHRDKLCPFCPVEKTFKTGQLEETDVVSSHGRNWILRGYPVRDESGRITGAVEVVTDITERKRAEEELKKYSEQLEDMVEERTRELRDAQEQLVRREKLAILGQLAGGVGHELRNPMGVISNAVYYLQMTLSDADETTREYLNIISSEVRNSDKIISDLLDFSRVRVGTTEKEETSVSTLFDRVLEKQPPPKNVEVTMEIPSDLPFVYVDSRQIDQVLVNLFTNACQAMLEGGRLAVKAGFNHNGVYISIADTGCGISGENMSKLFEPLFTTKARGIGLGLAVSKNLVEANGGSIEVESEEGKRSAFTVILPTKVSVGASLLEKASEVSGG